MTIVSSFCYAEGCSIYSTIEYHNDNVLIDNEIESVIIYKDEFPRWRGRPPRVPQ